MIDRMVVSVVFEFPHRSEKGVCPNCCIVLGCRSTVCSPLRITIFIRSGRNNMQVQHAIVNRCCYNKLSNDLQSRSVIISEKRCCVYQTCRTLLSIP